MPRPAGAKLYTELSLTQEDKAKIAEMFKILSTNGAGGLLAEARNLAYTLGPRVGEIHPIKMMEHVINTPDLKKQLHVIRTKDISVMGFGHLWTTYIKKTGKHLEKVHAKGELVFYAEDFAKAVKKDAEKVKAHFNAKDKDKWTALFDYLRN